VRFIAALDGGIHSPAIASQFFLHQPVTSLRKNIPCRIQELEFPPFSFLGDLLNRSVIQALANRIAAYVKIWNEIQETVLAVTIASLTLFHC